MRRLLLASAGAALLALPSASAAVPECFGAAARDPEHPCSNPALRMAARPGLVRSLITPSHPCKETEKIGQPDVRADGGLAICEFGVPTSRATRTVALLGDSHAMAWRAAVAGALRVLGWHGISMARSHCSFSAALRNMRNPDDITGCRRFNRRVVEWLSAHPEVTAVFAAHQNGGTPYITSDGVSEFETQVRGFAAAWTALPASIQHVFVIRDNPSNHGANHVQRCIVSARRAGASPGRFCGRPRRDALRPDAHVRAVGRLNDPRYTLVDLTSFMCSSRSCFPVVGGARVTKDGTHLTRMFARSLGPFLARAALAITLR
ncbi:MAG: hypothetical protein QOI80_3308 [Solirubrobacteraceae bacterium]|nr:hypothetical protein [Solirubrobacteraceae bacterium]